MFSGEEKECANQKVKKETKARLGNDLRSRGLMKRGSHAGELDGS